MVSILSSALKSPKKSPLSSIFSLLTLLSNHIFLADNVDKPSDFNSIFLTGFLETIFPTAVFPLILISAKSTSYFKTLNFCNFLK